MIIFAKNPIEGRVKTRLAKEIGNDKALLIYQRLLDHTYKETKSLQCDKFLFLGNAFEKNLFDENFTQVIQKGRNLGEKMKIAFADIFHKGYNKIIIIGTDCPGITSQIIDHAFESLSKYDYVIGPSLDGGYYLLGMNERSNYLFENMKWSINNVLTETIKKIEKRNFKYYLTEQLKDVDTLDDLKLLKK